MALRVVASMRMGVVGGRPRAVRSTLLRLVGVAGVAVLVGLMCACSSAGSRPAPATPTESIFGPDQVPRARPHVVYPFKLYVHCGVLDATFGGRDWVVVPPVVPASTPQPGFDHIFLHGTMTLLQRNVAEFRTDEGLVARFRPRRPAEAMPSEHCM